MANRLTHVLPNFTRYSNYGFKNQLSCVINITCSRYYAANGDDKDASSKSPSDDKEEIKQRLTTSVASEPTKAAAKKKLFDLLSGIKVTPQLNENVKRKDLKSNLHLTKPLPTEIRKERFKEPQKEESVKDPVEVLKSAMKEVAKTVKGDPTKIEMELTEKLNSMYISTGSPPESELKEAKLKEEAELREDPELKEDPKESIESLVNEGLSEELMSSVKDIASSVPAEQEPIQSELAKRLLEFATDQKSPEEQKQSLLNLFSNLKIDKKVPAPGSIASVQKQHVPAPKPPPPPFPKSTSYRKRTGPPEKLINLFGAPPLNIFPSPEEKVENKDRNLLWENLEKNQLRLLVQFAPANAFEEMILWTEQGRHWKFPIDNECDMRGEEKVGFHEHVFLDHHLDGFPKTGPVRHFMELVVVGLSKNPYITVQRKEENIEWFRQYFKEKESILEQYINKE